MHSLNLGDMFAAYGTTFVVFGFAKRQQKPDDPARFHLQRCEANEATHVIAAIHARRSIVQTPAGPIIVHGVSCKVEDARSALTGHDAEWGLNPIIRTYSETFSPYPE
jgi:hypothetical protein